MLPQPTKSRSLRFRKGSRLRRRHEFRAVGERGELLLKTPHFLVQALMVQSAPPAVRLGVTVSRRVGGAVVRNRVKRLLREAFRRAEALSQNSSADMVVIARGRAGQATWAEVQALFAVVGRRLSAISAQEHP